MTTRRLDPNVAPPGEGGSPLARALGQFTILLVDDEDDLRGSVRRILRSSEYLIREATNGHDALEILGREPIDLILSDFQMPHMDGLELLQRVRLSYPAVARVMLTGKSDVHLAARALNEGAVQRFVVKPWESVSLRGIVRLALACARGPR
jgi:response regulator RpfG family c-di-GMP phosphodiesterase